MQSIIELYLAVLKSTYIVIETIAIIVSIKHDNDVLDFASRFSYNTNVVKICSKKFPLLTSPVENSDNLEIFWHIRQYWISGLLVRRNKNALGDVGD